MRASWGLTETSRLPPSACVSHFACFVTRTTKDEVKLSIEVCVANDERESATKEEEASIASSPQYWCYCGSTKVGVQSERRCSLFSGRMRLVLPQKGEGKRRPLVQCQKRLELTPENLWLALDLERGSR